MVMSVRAALVAALSKMREALRIVREPRTRFLALEATTDLCSKTHGAGKFHVSARFRVERCTSHTVTLQTRQAPGLTVAAELSEGTMFPSLGTRSSLQSSC